ncbi:MAG: hypothetical protein ACRDHF_11345 [Tepidiformaceae bacterium]
MKDQIVAMLVDKANLDQAKAEDVVDKVLDFLKDHPDELMKLTQNEMVESVTKKGGLGKLFGR